MTSNDTDSDNEKEIFLSLAILILLLIILLILVLFCIFLFLWCCSRYYGYDIINDRSQNIPDGQDLSDEQVGNERGGMKNVYASKLINFANISLLS